MKDPWKFAGFPIASVSGYVVDQSIISSLIHNNASYSTIFGDVVVMAAVGLLAGFTVDQLIPAYLDKIRNRSGGGDDFGGGFDEDEDLDFE